MFFSPHILYLYIHVQWLVQLSRLLLYNDSELSKLSNLLWYHYIFRVTLNFVDFMGQVNLKLKTKQKTIKIKNVIKIKIIFLEVNLLTDKSAVAYKKSNQIFTLITICTNHKEIYSVMCPWKCLVHENSYQPKSMIPQFSGFIGIIKFSMLWDGFLLFFRPCKIKVQNSAVNLHIILVFYCLW